ncbi:MAG: ATP-binding protein [Acidimicrobiales bacterium]
MHRLLGRLHETKGGRGGVVLIEGEPGIGKTRLVEELAGIAREAGMAVVWSRCAETAGAPPFWPWIQVLRAIAVPGRTGPDADGSSSIASLLGTGVDEALAADDPAAARFRLSNQVVDHLLRATAERPLLVVFDDLHWADGSSRQLLEFVAGQTAGTSLLIVATFRASQESAEGLEDLLGALARERGTERFRLGGLSVSDVARYLELAGSTAPDAELASNLHQRTDGNPFFLIELVRLLTSEKAIHAGDWRSSAALEVPASVRDVIYRRMARLPEDTQTVLRVAAVIGREFDVGVLAAAAGLDVERLLELLEPAAATGLVVDTPDSWSSRFSHALLPEALYGSLTRVKRARIHRRVGEALEATLGPHDNPRLESHVDELAHHFYAALPTGTAANRGQGRPVRPPCRRVRGTQPGPRRGESDPAMISPLEELIAGTGTDKPALRAQLLGTLGVELYYTDQRDRREAAAWEAVDLARQVGDPALVGRVLNNCHIALWSPDREAERRAVVEESLALAGAGLPRETEVIARLHRMWSLLRTGDVVPYEAELAICERLAAEVGVPELAGQVLHGRTGLAILVGRWDEAEALSAKAMERLPPSIWGALWCRMVQLFWLRREQGRLDELLPELLALSGEPSGEPIRPTAVLALACLGRHDEARDRIGAWGCERPFDWSWDFTTAQWSEISILTGVPEAASLYKDLLPCDDQVVVAGTGVTSWGSTRTILGLLARRLGAVEEAYDHLTAAVAHNQRLGARPFEARARYHLARLLVEEPSLAGGQDADQLLDPAVEIAGRVGMDALLADIRELRTPK